MGSLQAVRVLLGIVPRCLGEDDVRGADTYVVSTRARVDPYILGLLKVSKVVRRGRPVGHPTCQGQNKNFLELVSPTTHAMSLLRVFSIRQVRSMYRYSSMAHEELWAHADGCSASVTPSTSTSSPWAQTTHTTHRAYSSSSSSSSDRKPIDYASSMLAAQIKSHILGSSDQISQSVKAWDITVTSPPRNPLWAVIEDYLVQHWQTMIAQFIQTRIDRSFDLEAFLESARDAFWAVNKFSTTSDFPLLKPMMSQGLYAATEAIYEGFRNKGLRYNVTVGDDISARMCGVGFLTASEMSDYGERSEDAEENVQQDNAMSGRHMVITVEFGSSITVDITKGAGEGGMQEVGTQDGTSTVVDSSPKLVKFVTKEPLPDKLPQEDLEVTWKVLKFA